MKRSREIFEDWQEDDYIADDIEHRALIEEEYEQLKKIYMRGTRKPLLRGVSKHKNRANKLHGKFRNTTLPF